MIKAVKLSDQVHKQLLAEILAGDLPPGILLSEVELAQRLGVSRTPVREALRRLAEHGLVEVRANHRAVVRRLDPHRLREVYQIREALEGLAAELACGSLAARDFSRLEGCISAIRDPNDPAYQEACHSFDLELHRLIAQRSGNALLAQEIEKFHILVQMIRECVAGQPGALALAFRQHLEIIQVLRTHNAALARQTMIDHIRASCEVAVRSAELAHVAERKTPVPLGGR